MESEPLYKLKGEFFKTLGHPARIRILELLAVQDRSVGELLPEIGIESSNLSQQLGVLRRAGVVDARKDGNTVIYSIASPDIAELLAVARKVLTSGAQRPRRCARGSARRPSGGVAPMGWLRKILRVGRVVERAPDAPEPAVKPPAGVRGSLQIRHVDAGSCNGCEVEIGGAFGPVYDAEQYRGAAGRVPPARRRAAGDRRGHSQHGRTAAQYRRGHTATASGDRLRRLRAEPRRVHRRLRRGRRGR